MQGEDISTQLSLANKIISAVTEATGDTEFDETSVEEKARQLMAVVNRRNNIAAVTGSIDVPRPETSLSASSLFTGSLNEPSMTYINVYPAGACNAAFGVVFAVLIANASLLAYCAVNIGKAEISKARLILSSAALFLSSFGIIYWELFMFWRL